MSAQQRQIGVVRGKITDDSGEILPGAVVSASGKTAVADGSGHYALDLPWGDQELKVSFPGYTSVAARIRIGRSVVKKDFRLESEIRELQAVTVEGKSASRQLKEGSLAANSVEVRTRASEITDLSAVVDRSAGVKVRRQGGVGSDFDLSVNGLSGNSIRYFIDGVPLDTRGSDVSLANIPVNMVDRIEVYKGVVPASLGADALGGAVNIVTQRNRKNFLDASYGIGSFHTQSADLAGQWILPGTKIAIRPTFGINYSKNDYMMKGVEVWDEASHSYIFADRRRFHDDYFSAVAQIEAGVSDVKWADAFFVSGNFSHVNKELQTGAMQNKVYGEARRKSTAWGLGMRYAKVWGGVSTRLNLSHTWDTQHTVDTALRKYSWDGTWMPSTGNEINNRARSIRVYRRPLTSLVAGADYSFNAHHALGLNYSLARVGNSRYDEVDDTFEPTSDALAKHIMALTYTQTLLESRLVNTAFVKGYINVTSIEQSDNSSVTGGSQASGHSVKGYPGGGVGSRYRLCNEVAFKASYEHSVRLPLSRELLGNGTTIYANLLLRPETSENVNAGIFGTFRLGDEGDHTLSYEAGYFLRHVKDYIRVAVSERDGMMQYENVPAVHVNGLDFELSYTWRQSLSVALNANYNDTRDLKKYKTDGKPSATYKNRVPNKPWAFVNAEAAYTLRNLLMKADRLRVSASYQWIHWYYLNWEAFGAAESKAVIPTQNVVNAALTYSIKNDRYSISLQCDNVFDALAYDNYMLQKPGRGFFVKFRISLF